MADTTHEPLGCCEQCGKPLMPGDTASYGGPDDIIGFEIVRPA